MAAISAQCEEPASILADSNGPPLPCLLGSKRSKQYPEASSLAHSRCSTGDSSLVSEFELFPRVSCVRNEARQRFELDVPSSPLFDTPGRAASCRASLCSQQGFLKKSLETEERIDEVPPLLTLPPDVDRCRTYDGFENPTDAGWGNTDVPLFSTLPLELERYRTDDGFENPTDAGCGNTDIPLFSTLPLELDHYRTDDGSEKPTDAGFGNTDVPLFSTLPLELDRYRTDDGFENPTDAGCGNTDVPLFSTLPLELDRYHTDDGFENFTNAGCGSTDVPLFSTLPLELDRYRTDDGFENPTNAGCGNTDVPLFSTLPLELDRYRTDDGFQNPTDAGCGNTDDPLFSTLASDLDRFRTNGGLEKPMTWPLPAALVVTAPPGLATFVQVQNPIAMPNTVKQPRGSVKHPDVWGLCCLKLGPNGRPRGKPCLDMLRKGWCSRMYKQKECPFCHEHACTPERKRQPKNVRQAAGGA